jgi:hypothetical protein
LWLGPVWLWTPILLISAYQVARITVWATVPSFC